MAIISKNKRFFPIQFKSAQFRYALIYIIVTLAVLLFLNIYSSRSSQEVFYNGKEKAMLEMCKVAASEISSLSILNSTTAEQAVNKLKDITYSRLLVTDHNGKLIFDTSTQEQPANAYALFPEIVTAIKGNDVFSWHYRDGRMESRAAIPVYSFGALTGCVYLTDNDAAQGALIASLEKNIFTITLVLEIAVVLFSFSFASVYSQRLRKIMTSIRTARSGDYTNQVDIGGNDELTSLGDEFNDLIRRLQISENKRRQFVSDASHELKTPLASIKLLSDSIMQNEMDEDTVREFVGDIGNEAERLNRMTQKLLTLTKAEVQPDVDCEIVYIEPTVNKVLRMLSVIANEHNIHMQTDIICDCPVLMQEDDLYQIIFNLAENGIKYNTPGGTLQICISREDDNAVILIQDTGTGIPEDAVGHIFERFYRVDKARSRSTGGAGLGLAIVKNLVERNKGTIHVRSQIGVGTTFTITFPIFDVEEEFSDET